MFAPLSILVRVFLALIFFFIFIKLLTKRRLSELTYFDGITNAIIGTIAGNLIINIKIHIFNFVFSMLLLLFIMLFIAYMSLKSRTVRKFLAGEPTVLIQNGKILENNMANLYYSYDYLMQQLRQEKVFDISQVEFAVLEPSGKLSVQLKSQNRSLTPQDLNLATKYEGLAIEVILDKRIIEENLQPNNLSEAWLIEELKKKGISNVEEVAFAALATNGNLYVDLYRD